MIRRLLLLIPGLFPAGNVKTYHANRILAFLFLSFLSASAFGQLQVTLDRQDPTCPGLPLGRITATASGGTTPYQYAWSNGASGPVASNLKAGTYTVTVTDGAGASLIRSATLVDPPPVVVVLTVDECKFPAVISAEVSGGMGPYNFKWDTGANADSTLVTLSGKYCVTVTDSKLCGVVACIQVTVNPFSVAVNTRAVTCPGGADGRMVAVPQGGLAPYSYLWSNGATTATVDGVSPGTYRVTVTDARGCTASAPATVADVPGILLTLTGTRPDCEGETDGQVTTVASGGTPPLSYRWNTGATTANLSGLAEGKYILTVTDGNGCTKVDSITLTPRSSLRLISFATNQTCPGMDDGFTTVNAQGGVPPYQYLWNNGVTTNGLAKVAPGTYSVTVTDAVGCVKTAELVVKAAPAFSIRIAATPLSTCGATDGTAAAQIVEGTGPFTYKWNTGSTLSTLTGLGAGKYIVTVTNGAGCPAVDSVTILEPPTISLQISATNQVCAGERTGQAIAIASGGTPPLVYSWNTGSTNDTIFNLGAGTYTVTVTDALNCRAVASATIQETPFIFSEIVASAIVCGGEDVGTARVRVAGGAPPYQYMWNTGASSESLDNLGSGTYRVTVTDANGCTSIAEATITIVEKLTLELIGRSALCFGEENGGAFVGVTGGDVPFRYLWSTGDTTNQVAGLAAGFYTVTVTDANGCSETGVVEVKEPDLLEVGISGNSLVCTGERSATLHATVIGGTQPYTYLWNTGATEDSLANLGPGIYYLTVTDANNCVAVDSFTVGQASDVDVAITGDSIVCGGAPTGSLTAVVTGGAAPVGVLWSTGATTTTITGLGTGTYQVTVTDANGCTAADTAMIQVIGRLVLQVNTTNVPCRGENTGSATVSVTSGGTGPFSFLWSNSATSASIMNVAAGNYQVTVTDANGCTASATATITQPAQGLSAQVDVVDLDCGVAGTGALTALVTGGTMPYTFAWSDGMNGAIRTGLNAGTFRVTVTDSKGCTAQATGTVQDFGPPVCNIVVTKPVSSPTATDGEAEVAVRGGTGPYKILWSTGDTTAMITELGAETYFVTITDAKGCTTTCSVAPTVVNALVGDFVWFDLNRNGRQDPGEVGVPGIPVIITRVDEANGDMDTTVTDQDGRYLFLVEPGSYKITFVIPDSLRITYQNAAGVPDSLDSDPDRVMFMTEVFVMEPGEVDLTWDAGLIPRPAGIVEDPCNCLNNATNEDDGQFGDMFLVIHGVPMDTWVIIGQTGMFDVNSPDPPAAPIPIAIGTVVVEKSPGEFEIPFRHVDDLGYSIIVTNGFDTLSLSNVCYYPTITVDNLPEDDLTLCINDQPFPITVTNSVPGVVEILLDGTPVTSIDPAELGLGEFELKITLTPFDVKECISVYTRKVFIIDGGCPAKLGDYVWLDEDRDGIQDPNERGISGVKAILQAPQNGGFVNLDTTVTDATGMYMFLVPAGQYKITFMPPANKDYAPTKANAGSDDARDSDMDPLTFMTPVYTLAPGENNPTIDAGFYIECINVDDPGMIGYDQYLCGPGNDPAPIISVKPPRGGQGVLEYLWMKSTVSSTFSESTYQPIPNSNSPTYDPGPVYQTTYFARCVRIVGCPGFLEPDPVKIEVGDKAQAKVVSPTVYCMNSSGVLQVETKTPGAVVKWEFDVGIMPRVAYGKVVTVNFLAMGSLGYKVTVSENNCTAMVVGSISVTGNPTYCPTGTTASAWMPDASVFEDRAIKVRWSNANDGLTYTYQVERSADGEKFSRIAEVYSPVAMQGNQRVYEYVDQQPKSGYNFYRVKMINQQGVNALSGVAHAIMRHDVSESILVYPNPVDDQLLVEFLDQSTEPIKLELFKSDGSRISRMELDPLTLTRSLNFSDLNVGVYILRVNLGEKGTHVIRVVKQ